MYLLSHYHSVNQIPISQEFRPVIVPLSREQDQKINPIQTLRIKNMENQLNTFIKWALKVTSSREYTGGEAMELLDQAWMAQKLLWRLRDHRNSQESLSDLV
jgi:hypothetical protein